MTQFIVFNTLNQAKNYIKRHRPRYFSDGCGCCWATSHYEIQDNKVLYRNYGESRGNRYYTVWVIGKIKGAGVITPIAA